MQRIWVSGYRAFELAVFDPKDPKKTIIERVLKEFLTQWLNQNEEESWLITGPQLGVEQWSAEAGLSLKEDYPRLKVAMMLPFADFASRWNEANQSQLASLKAAVDFSAEVSPQPYQSPEQLRMYQRFMFEHTDRLLLVYDPDQENNPDQKSKPYWLYRAAKCYQEDFPDYQVDLIDMPALEAAANEWAAEQNEGEMTD